MANQPIAATESEYDRFRRLLPPVVNLELVVLKGHLLIEEQLQRFLRDVSRHPKSLDDARLNFMQTAHLVRALGGLPYTDHSLWTLVVDLNKLRNRLAHRLEPGDVAAAVDCILRNYWQDEFEKPTSPRQRSTRLRQTLALNIAMLSGFASGATAAREPQLRK
ncbi:MAG: hypothetical protein WB992_00265 [Bryobacteraceae bacterium]